jgi:hypothetical protein
MYRLADQAREAGELSRKIRANPVRYVGRLTSYALIFENSGVLLRCDVKPRRMSQASRVYSYGSCSARVLLSVRILHYIDP